MREQLLRVAGVFAGDLVSFFENAEGAEVMSSRLPMGVPDEIESSRRSLWIGLACGELARRRVRELRGEFGTAGETGRRITVWSANQIEEKLSLYASQPIHRNDRGRQRRWPASFEMTGGLCLRTVPEWWGVRNRLGAEIARDILPEFRSYCEEQECHCTNTECQKCQPAHRKNRIGIRATLEKCPQLRRKGWNG